MAPTRIIIIRHAEKPEENTSGLGIDADGSKDRRSLIVRGWQRAGALTRFFCPSNDASSVNWVPNAVFAAGIGPNSKSRRPIETMEPLVALLRETDPDLEFVTKYPNNACAPAMRDVMAQTGTVLICWEHKHIPELVAELPNPPRVPLQWSRDRYDLIWIFDRENDGWAFSQLPQLLLAGDRRDLIV